MMNTVNRWLIIRNGAVGDTILLSPTIQWIRMKEPDAWIEVLGNQERVELLVGEGQADSSRDIESLPFHSLFSHGPLENDLGDYFSQFHNILYYTNNRNSFLEKRLRVHEDQWIQVWTAIPENDTGLHITKHYAKALQEFWEIECLPDPRISLSKQEREGAIGYLGEAGVQKQSKLLLVFHVGAGNEIKRASSDLFLRILNRIKKHFSVHLLVTMGPADEEVVKNFVMDLPSQLPFTLLENMPLKKLASILSQCDLTVGNDSGVTHLAAASGCPTIALFRNSNPAIWRPVGEHTHFVRV